MTHPKSIQINIRFFAALEALLLTGKLATRKEFCQKYSIDPGNLTRLNREPKRAFELAYLNYLVVDFDISAEWLLTGNGKMTV